MDGGRSLCEEGEVKHSRMDDRRTQIFVHGGGGVTAAKKKKDQKRTGCSVNVSDKMRKKAHSWHFNGFHAKQRGERGNGQLSLAASVADGRAEQQQLKAAA